MPISHNVGPSLGGSYRRSPTKTSQPAQLTCYQTIVCSASEIEFINNEKTRPGVMVMTASNL